MSNTSSPYSRYLDAKRTVDDRSLDLRVWQRLLELARERERELDVLEVGAGTGAMVARLRASGLPLGRYVAVERDPCNVAVLRSRVGAEVEVVESDLFPWLEQAMERGRQFDLVVACAVLDLLPLERVVPAIAEALREDGLLYLPIHFDGVTAFEPVIDPELDARIESLYHRTMDERRIGGEPSGDSRTGRRLLTLLPTAGLEIVAAAGSDWVVWPREGGYPDDEGHFLHALIDTVRGALVEATESGELEAGAFERWIDERHAQVDRGELVFLAHQLDVLARRRAGPAALTAALETPPDRL
jgi:SAM-dependent methyltransferase